MKQVILLTLYLIFLLLVFSFVSGAQPGVLYWEKMPAGFANAKISKAALQKDITYWQQVMEESHVNPYHAISKTDLQKLKEEVLLKLPDSISHAQASFALSELVGALNEGHLGLASNPVSDSLYAHHALRFPYLLSNLTDGAFIVQRDLSSLSNLPPGSRIVEVNGISTQTLYERYARYFGGLDTWKRYQVKDYIRKLLFMDGVHSPFRIKAIVTADTLSFTVNGFSRSQADSINKSLALTTPPAFSFHLSDDGVAHIDFNSMDGRLRDSFSRFLQHSFAEMQRREAKGLVIDLRNNGGGDSGLGDSLLSYITDKSYQSTGGMKMRISSHFKAVSKIRGWKDEFADWKDGSLYEWKPKGMMKLRKNPLRFRGKMAVLIGPGTFSSANMLANAIKDYNLATLIGGSTAEPGNDFGEVFSFMLPNTRIVATSAAKMFVRANGDAADFEGIKPDIYVTEVIGEDKAMATAVEWVKK